ncbi:MAG: pilus assembly protein PilM [Oscillospiraceae bacterium]|nr:pilus assembly protein PilM [Oscillospiraceae bacterium]
MAGHKKSKHKQNALKPQDDTIFALDIGTRTVVGVIGVQTEDSSGASVFDLQDYVVVPHTKRAMIDGQIEDARQVAKIVLQAKEQLQARTGIKLKRVSISASGHSIKTKRVTYETDVSAAGVITRDTIRSLELEAIQQASAQINDERGVVTPYHCVGFSVITYSLDGHKLFDFKFDESPKGTTAGVELVATFLPNAVVDGLYSVMDMCSLTVENLILESVAAMNAVAPTETRFSNIALVDIGAGTSDIAVSKNGSIAAYATATISGDEITEMIIKSHFVDFDTAERIKQTCCSGEDCSYKDVFGIERFFNAKEFVERIKPIVETLATAICENIIAANTTTPAVVFLVGGGSLVKGLPQAISANLSLPLDRVVVGSDGELKSINTNGKTLGAEMITPLGIAVTAMMKRESSASVIAAPAPNTIKVTLNGDAVELSPNANGSPHTFIELLNYIDLDLDDPQGKYFTMVNGKIAGFSDILKNGDEVVLEWQK